MAPNLAHFELFRNENLIFKIDDLLSSSLVFGLSIL